MFETQLSNANEGRIAAWCPDERPREKLRRFGGRILSDAELLAAILGSGTAMSLKSMSAVGIGRFLLKRYGSLRALAALEARELTAVPGIGPARSAQLAAVFEVGRRVAETPLDEQAVLRSPSEVAARFAPSMRDLSREVFKVVLLNTAARMLDTFIASEGGLAASIVEPRIVFRRAILSHAASIICLHNHPSGNSEPSSEDVQITKQLVEAGRVIGIPVQDHLIIAGDGYTSFAERGLI